MKSIWLRSFAILVGVALLPSCTARYQQLLMEKDRKIKELYGQVAEFSATNQDLESRERGARDRISSLEQRLAQRNGNGSTGLDELKRQLGPDVDVRVRNNRLSLGINNRVTFSSGSKRLKKSAEPVLSKVAGVLKRNFAGHRIIVEGHTDDDPLKRTKNLYRNNRHLSLERADAVANFLIDRCGVREATVVVAGYGPHRPLRSGRGKAAKAANRRVEIVVTDEL